MEAMAAAKPVIKVAALCGSLREGSYNRGLLRYGKVLLQIDVQRDVLVLVSGKYSFGFLVFSPL